MLSIIIPTMNEEEYLPLLLESIKKQNFNDYEIIIADAGSKDKTIDIAKKYRCQVVKGGLLPVGRNSGAEASRGDTILFLDSDIILPHPKFLENILTGIEKRGLGLAVFPLIPSSEKKIDKFSFFIWNKWCRFTQKFFPHGASAFLVKRNIHKLIGGFDEKIQFVEDQPYVAACKKITKFGIVKEEPIFVSVRRFDKDGRLNVYLKYLLADLHLFFWGPIKSDIFKYKFGHYGSSIKD